MNTTKTHQQAFVIRYCNFERVGIRLSRNCFHVYSYPNNCFISQMIGKQSAARNAQENHVPITITPLPNIVSLALLELRKRLPLKRLVKGHKLETLREGK